MLDRQGGETVMRGFGGRPTTRGGVLVVLVAGVPRLRMGASGGGGK